MEIIITAPTESQYLQKIDFNYEELKQSIKASLEKYDNLLYTDDQMKAAKTDRANLNNFIKALDAKRKEVKEKCLAPYAEFEAKIKELQALVEEPVLRIDNQIKTYENGKKAEKKTKLLCYYKENAGEIADLVDFEQIFEERWLNSSASLSCVCKEVDAAVIKIRDGLKAKGYAAKKGYSFWEKDFDGMAYKTMLRQLISKWGIMSIDMLTALEKDMATIKDNGDPDYVDAQEPLTIDATPIDPENLKK